MCSLFQKQNRRPNAPPRQSSLMALYDNYMINVLIGVEGPE